MYCAMNSLLEGDKGGAFSVTAHLSDSTLSVTATDIAVRLAAGPMFTAGLSSGRACHSCLLCNCTHNKHKGAARMPV